MNKKIKEYNLRIVPPSPVLEEVTNFKKQFRAVFGEQLFSKSKPHITVGSFLMNSDYEDTLIRILNQLSGLSKFELDIGGFDIFEKGSNTLHLKVTNPKDLKNVHRDFNILWIRDLHRKRTSLKESNTPHMTISKTTGKNMLYESLAYFQKTGYSRRIAVNQLTLVSRHEHKTWGKEHQIELSQRVR